MTTTTLRAAYSTWVQEDAPTKNWFRKTGYLRLYGVPGRRNQGIVWFANPFPSSGANVVKATLTVKSRAVAGTGATQMAVALAAKWSSHFGTVNWNTKPSGASDQAVLSKANPLSANTPWVFDVTAQMQKIASGQGFFGFVLSSSSTHATDVQGNMSAALDPSLSVEWQENPLPPTDLAPSTGQAVGTGSPVLRWSYRDYVGGDVLASCQVRTGTSETTVHTAPSWDSGEVATTVSQLDLSAQSSWTPPEKDTVVWWQVRCRDSSGVWSGWSDAVSWKWHALPTVTLTQPDPVSGTFSDPTPPIAWTYTGDMPQTRYRASVSILRGSTWHVVWASGMVVGADTSCTPDVGLASAGTVRVVVDVWDGRHREATPGMAIYGSARQEFTFAPTKTVVAVSGLTVTPDPVLPSVTLSWTRSEVPDRVDVYRDSKLLSSHEGLDWFVSGTLSRMTDAACPGGPHTWKVFAIVNGKASKSAAVTATVKHRGTWIVDEDTGDRVCIVGDTDHDMPTPETVTELSPIGGHSKVRITSAQYGYEGTLTGQLAPQIVMPATETPALWRERLLAWKANPGKTLRLLIEDLGFRVNLSEISVTSYPARAGEIFNVTLKFHQVDNFTFGED